MVKHGKELQYPIFWATDHLPLKEFQHSGSGHVWILWFHGQGVGLVPGITGSQNYLLCACFSCMTFGLNSVVFEKQFSILLERG